MIMHRLIKENYPEIKAEIVVGTFKNEGHYWNVIDDRIIDLTADQFGKYKVGIINKKFYNNYKIEDIKTYSEQELKRFTEDIYDFILIWKDDHYE